MKEVITVTEPIVIVSGLPRSGTSLLMSMLQHGGFALCTDGIRKPDVDNPKGYFEYEPARNIQQDSSFIGMASGKAIKVVSHLLQVLPSDFHYRVIFLERDLHEVLESQRKMMTRLHSTSSSETVPASINTNLESELDLLKHHLVWISDWLHRQPNIETLNLAYLDILHDPQVAACRISKFLGIMLDVDNMVRAVDATLYRTKDTDMLLNSNSLVSSGGGVCH